MNCCICKKPLPVGDPNQQRIWFGLYRGADLVRAICEDCKDTPAGKDWPLEAQDGKV